MKIIKNTIRKIKNHPEPTVLLAMMYIVVGIIVGVIIFVSSI